MSNTMNRRLIALERRQTVPAGPCAYESEEVARAAGATGGYLLIRPAMEPEEWAAAAERQQAELMRWICNAT